MNHRRRQATTFLAMAMIATLLLAACGSAIQSGSDIASPDEIAEETVDLSLPAAFEISMYQGEDMLGGQQVEFAELFDEGKPVVLNLWAGLCPPCRLEMPDFEAVNQEMGDEVLFVGLDVGPFTNLGTSADGQALIQELGVTYPVGTTDNAEVVRDLGLIGMPTTYFFTPNGEMIEQWTGLLTEEKLTELVEELIEASATLAVAEGGAGK